VVDFSPLVVKVKQRIHNWKTKYISFAGQRQLIISVLQSIQLYWMSVFVFLASVIHELESLFRDFFWTQEQGSKGRCHVAWNDVCKPRDYGGLGIRKLVHGIDCLSIRWVRSCYIQNCSIWIIPIKYSWSSLFRKIMGVRN